MGEGDESQASSVGNSSGCRGCTAADCRENSVCCAVRNTQASLAVTHRYYRFGRPQSLRAAHKAENTTFGQSAYTGSDFSSRTTARSWPG